MSFIHGLGQRIGNPRSYSDHGGLLDAELHGDRVGGLKSDAADIARQAIRVLGHDLDGVGTIGLEDPHRPRRTDTVAVQEHHDFPHRLLLGPGGRMLAARTGPMPSTSRNRSGVASMTSNTFSPKARRASWRKRDQRPGSCRTRGTSRCRRPKSGATCAESAP